MANWQKQKPSKVGYYWYQDEYLTEPTVVYVDWNGGDLWAENPGLHFKTTHSNESAQWCYIPEPK